MIIDWFTFLAQVMNFIILVWLLKRFLYQPILDAVDAREQKIATALLDADEKKLQAEQQFHLYETKNKAFEQQSSALLKQAVSEADLERERLIGEGRDQAAALRLKQMENLRKGAEQLNQDIRQQTQQQVFSVTRKLLGDLASAGLEQILVENFLAQMHKMDKAKRIRVTAALKTTHHPALLRSAFELTPEQREFIQNEFNQIFETEIKFKFETEDNLIAGLELVSNGQKLAWSISDYLGSLEKTMAEILNRPGGSKDSVELESLQVQQQQ
jgi:F-type H+-transporting ATPase subunit b